MTTGILITFEGIDGSGKSSAAKSLFVKLNNTYPVILTREPGASDLGKQLRSILQRRTFDLDPKAEFLLFAADRVQHMETVVLPALRENKIVISDRMADSSLAYQGYGRGVDPAMITRINGWAMHDRQPDLTIYLEIGYEQATQRLANRQEEATVFEQERASFFARVRQGFETAFEGRRVARIDAAQSEQEVQNAVYLAVTDFLYERNYHETSPRELMDRA